MGFFDSDSESSTFGLSTGQNTSIPGTGGLVINANPVSNITASGKKSSINLGGSGGGSVVPFRGGQFAQEPVFPGSGRSPGNTGGVAPSQQFNISIADGGIIETVLNEARAMFDGLLGTTEEVVTSTVDEFEAAQRASIGFAEDALSASIGFADQAVQNVVASNTASVGRISGIAEQAIAAGVANGEELISFIQQFTGETVDAIKDALAVTGETTRAANAPDVEIAKAGGQSYITAAAVGAGLIAAAIYFRRG